LLQLRRKSVSSAQARDGGRGRSRARMLRGGRAGPRQRPAGHRPFSGGGPRHVGKEDLCGPTRRSSVGETDSSDCRRKRAQIEEAVGPPRHTLAVGRFTRDSTEKKGLTRARPRSVGRRSRLRTAVVGIGGITLERVPAVLAAGAIFGGDHFRPADLAIRSLRVRRFLYALGRFTYQQPALKLV